MTLRKLLGNFFPSIPWFRLAPSFRLAILVALSKINYLIASPLRNKKSALLKSSWDGYHIEKSLPAVCLSLFGKHAAN